MKPTKLYRYCKNTGFGLEPTTIDLLVYEIIRETECTWVIKKDFFSDKLSYVPKVSKKKYAYPNIKDAELNFKLRTEKHLKILEKQVSDIKSALSYDIKKASVIDVKDWQ